MKFTTKLTIKFGSISSCEENSVASFVVNFAEIYPEAVRFLTAA